ncbi:TPA: Lpg1974 family pore-forming outer membrane protein, partial [Legionella pneumophila]
LRKTTLSLFIIGFCNTQSSIAGTMGPVNTGCTGNRLFAGADGLYLQPRNDDLDYATFLVDNYTKTLNTYLDYDWGFRLYGGIKFANNNDITIAWQRLHTRDNDLLLGDGNIAI